jgi:hypothetical protein
MSGAARRILVAAWVVVCAGGPAGCGGLRGPSYEYEEEIRLSLDGSARVDVHASVAALAALRGLNLESRPGGPADLERLRRAYQGSGVEVESVRRSRRAGREFVHVRLDVADIRSLNRIEPFSWSSYEFGRRGELVEYRQRLGDPAGRRVETAGWAGDEIVAVRLHVPSRIPFHNAPSRQIRRGNILEWEQPLAERLRGLPIDVQVSMESESILYTTLVLFGSTIALALAAFAVVIWRLARRGRGNVGQPSMGG